MRLDTSIVVTAALLGCSEDGRVTTIDATVQDGPDYILVDVPKPRVGDEPPREFGPWPGRLPDVIRTDDVFSLAPADVIQTPRCVPGTTVRCVCDDLREGLQGCYPEGAYRPCACPPPVPPPARPLPPRLLRPLSGMRVTSQRPALRWVLPAGVTQARVELCADRPCTRVLQRAEVSGTTWRPTTRLPPGVVFWRVHGVGANGAVAWTSATWEFAVRHSDAPVDSVYGTLKDYNGDGYDDLVAVMGTTPAFGESGTTRGRAFVFHGSSAGITATPNTRIEEELCGYSSAAAVELESVDVNGDGIADLVSSSGQAKDPCGFNESVFVYHGGLRGLGVPSRRLRGPVGGEWGSYGISFATGDVNGDGFGDVIVLAMMMSYSEYRLLVHLGSSDGVSSTPLISNRWGWRDVNVGGFDTTTADVDGDGYTDVVSQTFDATVVFYGDPDGSLLRAVPMPTDRDAPLTNRFAIDINGDERSDLIGGSPTTLWEAVGGSLLRTYLRFAPSSRVRLEPDLLPYGIVGRPGDGNGDGVVDVVSRDFCVEPSREPCTTGVISIFERNAAAGGIGAPRDLRAATPRTSVTFAGDLDGDGADELVVADDATLEVHSLTRRLTRRHQVSVAPTVLLIE